MNVGKFIRRKIRKINRRSPHVIISRLGQFYRGGRGILVLIEILVFQKFIQRSHDCCSGGVDFQVCIRESVTVTTPRIQIQICSGVNCSCGESQLSCRNFGTCVCKKVFPVSVEIILQSREVGEIHGNIAGGIRVFPVQLNFRLKRERGEFYGDLRSR